MPELQISNNIPLNYNVLWHHLRKFIVIFEKLQQKQHQVVSERQFIETEIRDQEMQQHQILDNSEIQNDLESSPFLHLQSFIVGCQNKDKALNKMQKVSTRKQ